MIFYITLDYELFLGEETGTPENCLIRPMNALLKMAAEKGIKYTIFVDATYLLRLKQFMETVPKLREHFEAVTENLRKCVEDGHDVQLHIHPQWIYSDWDVGHQRWIMDKAHYKLSDMPLEKAKKLISDAKEVLDEIVGYKTIAFRAGGFCLDNFVDYKQTFKELGLVIDSSVARKQFVKSPIHSYDYRDIPNKQIYSFSNSIKEEKSDGEFKELSISSFCCSPLYFLLKVRKQRNNYSPNVIYKDGESISDGKNLLLAKIKKLFSSYTTFCSLDSATSCYLNEFYKGVKADGHSEMILIGHPKNASDVSIQNLKIFVENHMKDKFRVVSDLIK